MIEHFRNTRTGHTFGVNPGSPAHERMVANPGEFERVEPEQPKPAPKRKSRKTANNPHPGGLDEFAPADEGGEQS